MSEQRFSDQPVTSLSLDEWDNVVEEKVVVEGRANNRKIGAIVELTAGMVLVEGVGGWSKDVVGKRIQVQGELLKVDWGSPQPIAPGEPVRTGGSGRHFALEKADWVVVGNEIRE